MVICTCHASLCLVIPRTPSLNGNWDKFMRLKSSGCPSLYTKIGTSPAYVRTQISLPSIMLHCSPFIDVRRRTSIPLISPLTQSEVVPHQLNSFMSGRSSGDTNTYHP